MSKIQDSAKLRRLADLINQERWIGMDIDVKGEIYEGLQRNAEDTKSIAGQYFTPRLLIQAIVDVIRPSPGETICVRLTGAPLCRLLISLDSGLFLNG
jgi:type I restriction enzyme M protein